MRTEELVKLKASITPGPWWDESGVVHAKHPKKWTEQVHACDHICAIRSDRPAADVELVCAAPELLDEVIRTRDLLERARLVLNAFDHQTSDLYKDIVKELSGK